MTTTTSRSTAARRAHAAAAWLSALPMVVAGAFGCAALALLGMRLTDAEQVWPLPTEPGEHALATPLDVPRRPQRVEVVVRSPQTDRAGAPGDGLHRPWDPDGTAASPVASLGWLAGVDGDMAITVAIDTPASDWAFDRTRAARTLLCTLRDDGLWACGFDFFTHDGADALALRVRLDGDTAGLEHANPHLVIRPHPAYQRINDLAMGATGLFALLFGVAGARSLRPRTPG